MESAYRLGTAIAATGAFTLHRAQRVSDGASVLVKRHADDDVAAARREHGLMGRLDGAGITRPLALEGRYLVLPDLAGEPLEDVLARGALEPGRFLRLARAMALALGTMHAARLVACDLRPAHWLVDAEQGTAWLLDLRRALPEPLGPAPPPARDADWATLAPEQTGRLDRAVDTRADLYALGAIFYRMLCGEPPFLAHDALEWVHCHLARRPAAPAERQPGVQPGLSALVMKLLSKRPEDRYRGVHGLLADLERCAGAWAGAAAVPAFELGTDDAPERFQLPAHLVGRDSEIAALNAAFERAARGQANLVTVCGPAGSGKTALVNELAAAVARRRGFLVAGRCDRGRQDVPYATLATAVHALVRQVLAVSEGEIAAWRQRLTQALGSALSHVVDIAPQLALVVGEVPPPPAWPAAEAQHRVRRPCASSCWRARAANSRSCCSSTICSGPIMRRCRCSSIFWTARPAPRCSWWRRGATTRHRRCCRRPLPA